MHIFVLCIISFVHGQQWNTMNGLAIIAELSRNKIYLIHELFAPGFFDSKGPLSAAINACLYILHEIFFKKKNISTVHWHHLIYTVMYNEKGRKLKPRFVIISWRLFWQWNSLIMFWLKIKYIQNKQSQLYDSKGVYFRVRTCEVFLWGYCFPALYCSNKLCFLCFTWLVVEC